jgi:hypothetical protein
MVESSPDYQVGSFLAANLPAGEYTLELTFTAGARYVAVPDGTTYSLNDGPLVPADSDVVDEASEPPYTHRVTIENLALDGDATLHIYFGDVG